MDPFHNLDQKLGKLRIKPFGGTDFTPLSPAELSTIEQALGACLPAPYRWFLTTYGESGFSENVYFPLRNGRELLPFGYFYGISSILDGIQSPPDTMPEMMFPIGDEGLGNLYCLGFRDAFVGRVYYWDQQIGWEAEADELIRNGESVTDDLHLQCVQLIANSFEELIDSMVVKE